MFDFLRSYNDARINYGLFAVFLKDFGSLLDKPFHGAAGFSLRLFSDVFENFFEAFDMRLCLFQMFPERVL